MSDGGEKTVTSTTNNEPWVFQRPFLHKGFQEAERLYTDNPIQYYPGQTVADFQQATTGGHEQTLDQATQNAGLLRRTVGGEFLNAGNPYFQGMVNQIGQSIRPTIDSAFASSGRLGSGAHAAAMSSALADQAGKLAYQNYATERGNQIAASQDYSPFQAMVGVGGAQQAQQQAMLNDMAKRWDFQQNEPNNRLATFMNMVGNRGYGGTTSTSQPYQSNGLLQGVGTGISALGALGSLGQGAAGLKSLFGF